MDNYEKKIQEILKKEVFKPSLYHTAIKKALSKEKKPLKLKTSIYKILPIACCCFFAISGIGFATYTIYEKIWKSPTVITEDIKNKNIEILKQPITDEEKKEMINDKTAIEIANKTLNILGYTTTNFNEINIVRGYDSKNHYVLHTEADKSKGFLINIDPLTGDLEYFCNNDIIYQNIKSDNISEEEAKKVATEIYSKLNIITENDEYEIISAKKQNIVSGNNVNDMWQVSFSKKDSNQFDNDTIFTTVFAVVDGKTIIYIVKGKNEVNFEDNQTVITKEEAINIAIEKEKEFSTLEISEINVTQSTEKMNLFVYALENNITNENGEYQIENIARNVWVVEIKHKKDTKPKDSKIETVKTQYNKKFFVDITTGEIIGGEQSEFFNN